MDPTTGIIALKGTTTLYSGNKIVSSDGNSIQFGNGVAITGSIISTVTPLVSGSSQISFTGLSNVPSGIVSGSSQVLSGTGIWSGSAQLPSGVVSGSVQVDVMSTTNIARLATTGSNTFVGNQIVSGSLTTTGDITINSNGAIFNRTSSGEPYLFFRKDGVNRGSIYGITGGGLRLFDQSDNQVFTMTGSMIGINKISPTSTLDVQGSGANGIVLSADSNDANNSGRVFMMRTGGEGWCIMNNAANLSFRSNAVPGSTSGNERMKLDSSYNLILNNGLSVAGATNQAGALRMNSSSAGNSPHITFGTEDETVAGHKGIYLETYWMILQPHVNEGLRIRFVNGSGTQTETVRFQSTQTTAYTNFLPGSDASYNLGSTSLRWNNVYTTDLHLSNEGKQNSVDGTWGDWTLQEGENDIYMLNNRSGEKFKIKLEKIIE
jgi:hypothetical protein